MMEEYSVIDFLKDLTNENIEKDIIEMIFEKSDMEDIIDILLKKIGEIK
jgi:hypothetical protein